MLLKIIENGSKNVISCGVGGWGGEGGIVLNSQTLTLSLPHEALKEFKGIDRTFI